MASLTLASLCWALLFLFVVVFAAEAQNTVTAKSGQDVVLPCRVPSDKTIRAVKWSRADLGKDYVLLYRDEQLDPEEQHLSFKNRVDLQDRQMKDGDVSLVLKNVTTADGGTYNCNIFNGETGSWEIINTVGLTVSGHTGGHTEEGSVGLIAGLSVSAVLVVAVVGFLIYRKHNQPQSETAELTVVAPVGLIAGLSVPAVLVAAVVGFLCYGKHKQQNRDFNQHPHEQQVSNVSTV